MVLSRHRRRGDRSVRILMVSSEMAPLASSGDLGEAVSALVRALVRRGHELVVVLPDYQGGDNVTGSAAATAADPVIESLGPLGAFPTAVGPRLVAADLCRRTVPGAAVVRLQCPPLFNRPGLYGDPDDYPDNPDRFWVLSIGAAAVLRRLGWVPDIAHGHDWHAGWLPAVLRSQSDFHSIPTVYTGYDLRMPGSAPIDWARKLGVVPSLLTPEGIEYYGAVSFAKVGLRFADMVVMSSTEARDPAEGLAGVVRARGASVTRIPRSLDAVTHDPSRDVGLPARYAADALEGKAINKRRLQAATGLEINPLAVIVLGEIDPAGEMAVRASRDQQVQWLPLDGLPIGLRRLAFAGADVVLEASGDPWSTRCRAAERYGLAVLIPATPEAPEDAYTYSPDGPDFGDAIDRLVTDHSDQELWQQRLRERLSRDPELGVARYETLYRQVLSVSAGEPIAWATGSLSDDIEALGT